MAGQIVSLGGTWMQQVALGWLVYRLTSSAFLLGLVAFCGQFPILVVAPLAGVWADRHDRRRVVLATQAAGMLQALALAALVFTGSASIGWILTLSLALGVVNGVDVPARQALMVEMVGDRADLPNAIALNSSVFNASRLGGPALGGLLVAVAGEGVVFLVNGMSYVVVLAALRAVRVPARRAPAHRPALRRDLREGLAYGLGTPPLRALLLLVGGASLFGVPFGAFLPVLADDVLGGGPRLLGVLAGAVGFGSTLGALHLAHRPSVAGLERVIRRGSVVFGLALLGLGAARSAALAVAACLVAGFGLTSMKAAANTVLQTVLDDRMRGRVMSLYAMAFIGTPPLGSLAAGALAQHLGVPATIGLGGLGTLLATAVCAGGLPAMAAPAPPPDAPRAAEESGAAAGA